MEVEPLNGTQLEDLGLNSCNNNIPFSSREVPILDEPEPQPEPLSNCPPLDASLGNERGLKPPIKPHSPDSFRMKVVETLTVHTPPLHHVASFHPKDMLYLIRRSLKVLKKFHWTIFRGRLNQLSHVSSPLLSKPGENSQKALTVRMKALLKQEELPAATIVAYDNVIQKKALILCLVDQLEDVLATLNSKELQKMTKAKGDGGERLYVRGRFGHRDIKHGKCSMWSSRGRSNKLKFYICQSDEHLKRDCPSADVVMVMSVEQQLDGILNSRGSYHMTYMRDYLVDFEEYNDDNVLLGNGRECCVRRTGKVHVHMRDGTSFMLDNVRVPLERRDERPAQPIIVYLRVLDINYFCHFLDILENYNPMDDEPMWAADRVVALTLGFAITIPETTNEVVIK
nr:hypothetical protein [Tanacetum cinerariifolium]